jgi:hypothetical protein
VHTIDDLNIVKIYELLCEGKFSLGSRLLEALTGLAISCSIIATVSCCELFGLVVVLGTTSDCTTPYNVKAVVIDGNFDIP